MIVLKRKIIIIPFAAALLFIVKYYNLTDFFSFENINGLKAFINSYGMLSPLVFIVIFIIATIAFIPGLPIAVLAGMLFGLWRGTLYVVIGSTIGVSASFLIGRYLGRDLVLKLAGKNERMAKLDGYIKQHGDTILIISRLVPIFPFNLQNYAYGVTDIKFGTYFWYSLIFMIPGTFIYACFGDLASSSVSTGDLIIYSSLLLTALCLLIIIPRRIFNLKNSSVNRRQNLHVSEK